jgi:hypothetical protein
MVFGWVIINYADNGFQFFLGDGTFYREIRKGGVEVTTVSPKWLSYPLPDKPDVPRDANEYQLSQLITQLRDPDYFQHFADPSTAPSKTCHLHLRTTPAMSVIHHRETLCARQCWLVTGARRPSTDVAKNPRQSRRRPIQHPP